MIDVTELYELDDEKSPEISEIAIHGTAFWGYQTIRVTVYVNKKFLIDFGSTNNFLDVHIARNLGCKVDSMGPMRVDVANGSSINYDAICKGLLWVLQGIHFKIDPYILPLGSCDMVLGIQWLETLWEIKWDFKQLRMEFMFKGKKHVLRGRTSVNLKAIKGKQLHKLLGNPTQCSSMQLCNLQMRDEVLNACAAVGVTVM